MNKAVLNNVTFENCTVYPSQDGDAIRVEGWQAGSELPTDCDIAIYFGRPPAHGDGDWCCKIGDSTGESGHGKSIDEAIREAMGNRKRALEGDWDDEVSEATG